MEHYQNINCNKKYQMMILLIISLNYIVNTSIMAGFIYHTHQPVFICNTNESEENSYHICDSGMDVCLLDNKELIQVDETSSLRNWTFRMGLYCDKEYYIPMMMSALFIGGIFSSLTFSQAADKYGRRPVYLILTYINTVVIGLFFIINNPKVMVFLMFTLGMTFQIYTIVPIIISEYMSREYYAIIVTYTNLLYPITGLLIAYFYLHVNNYEVLFGLIFVIGLTSNILAWNYLFESPKWLLSMGKEKEFIEILEKIAKLNGKKEEIELERIKKNYNETNVDLSNYCSEDNELNRKREKNIKQLKLTDVFGRSKFSDRIIVFSLIWLFYGFAFFGLMLNTEKIDIAENFYTNSAIFFIGEFIANLISGYFAQVQGRLITFKLCSIIGGISFIIFQFTTEHYLKTVLLFIASLGISGGFNLCYILTPESFSLRIRSTVGGFFNLLSRMGSLIVPCFTLFVRSGLPIVFGSFVILAGMCSFYLNETMRKDYEEETLSDMEELLIISTLVSEDIE